MTVSLILGFAAVISGCATGESRVSGLQDISISAEATAGGIAVGFSGFSPEIKDIWVTFRDWGEGGEPDWENTEAVAVFSRFREMAEATSFDAIKQFKQTGSVVFPFVQSGHRYSVTVQFINSKGEAVLTRTAECTAAGGIYLNSSISLNLNDKRTGVVLSGTPAFTPDVQYRTIGYSIVALTGDFTEGIISGDTGDLSWEFEGAFSEHLKEAGVENGDYPAYVEANLYIIHAGISWVLNFADSPVFVYSF
jgi:hypothetical protein